MNENKILYNLIFINQTTSQAQFNVFDLWRSNFDQIIQGQYARFPLCFPNGYPRGAAPLPCYRPGWGGSILNINVPCLPPIVLKRLVPPCVGPYVVVTNRYANGINWQ